MEYPPEYEGASDETIARNAISKVATLTSTYDHRVIQGAQSGDFPSDAPPAARRGGVLRRDLRRAADPYESIRWSKDIAFSYDDQIGKQARTSSLIRPTACAAT